MWGGGWTCSTQLSYYMTNLWSGNRRASDPQLAVQKAPLRLAGGPTSGRDNGPTAVDGEAAAGLAPPRATAPTSLFTTFSARVYNSRANPLVPANLSFSNGDGLLLYPGPDGPYPSIRLENLRDGVEDYSLLKALSTASEVAGFVRQVVTSRTGFDAAWAGVNVTVATPAAFEAVRRDVAAARQLAQRRGVDDVIAARNTSSPTAGAGGASVSTAYNLTGPVLVPQQPRGAACLDGSPPGYFIRRGDPTKGFVIHTQGGGWCWDTPYRADHGRSCHYRATTGLGSSSAWSEQHGTGDNWYCCQGLLSANASVNPDYYDWTLVFVGCVSATGWAAFGLTCLLCVCVCVCVCVRVCVCMWCSVQCAVCSVQCAGRRCA
jgi:hypothetical protein